MATATTTQRTAEDPVKVDPKHYTVEFENDRVRVNYGNLGARAELLPLSFYRVPHADLEEKRPERPPSRFRQIKKCDREEVWEYDLNPCLVCAGRRKAASAAVPGSNTQKAKP